MRSNQRRIIGGSAARNDSIDNETKMPYPHLASFIKKHTEYRFGKKVSIDSKPNNKTVMEEQLKQIHDKHIKEQEEKLRRREDELKGYLTLVDDMDRDQKEKEIELISKRREFLSDIDNLKQQKAMKNQLERASSKEYQYTYFPYTHGDNIEKKRQNINDQLKVEMKDYYRNKKTPFLKDALSNKSSLMTPSSYSRQSAHGMTNDHKKRSLSSGLKSDTDSVFLKPHTQHLHRFISDDQLEDNNKKALMRYEQELLKQKQRRNELEGQLKQHALAFDEFKTDQKERKRKKIAATRKALDEQHREQEDKKLREFFENKKYTHTHFGPEEGEELKQLYKAKREEEKKILDEGLKAQIAAKQQLKDTDKVLNTHVDKVFLENAKAMLDAETKEMKLKKQLQQKKNVQAWNQQQEMKVKDQQTAF